MMSELDRLGHFNAGEAPVGPAWRYRIVAKDDVRRCAGCIQATVRTIAAQSPDTWPSDAEWRELLPPDFVGHFPSISTAEAHEFFTRTPREAWSTLPWDFGSWLDAIRDRGWRWWSSAVQGESFEIVLKLEEWPASLEAFEQIITACGGEISTEANRNDNTL